jgi:hypothetical protein
MDGLEGAEMCFIWSVKGYTAIDRMWSVKGYTGIERMWIVKG